MFVGHTAANVFFFGVSPQGDDCHFIRFAAEILTRTIKKPKSWPRTIAASMASTTCFAQSFFFGHLVFVVWEL